MRAVLLLATFLPLALAAQPADAFPRPNTAGVNGIAGPVRGSRGNRIGGARSPVAVSPRGAFSFAPRGYNMPVRGDWTAREIELAGEMRLLDRRIDRLRDSGQISRRQARNMRRDAYAITDSWYRFRSDGLSDSEADELQSRLLAANSLARPAPAPRGR